MGSKTLISRAIALAIVIVALAIGYYFVIFLPNLHAQQDSASNQASCLQMEQPLLTQIRQQTVQSDEALGFGGGDTYSPIKAHYETSIKECFVEIDDSFMSTGQQGYYTGNDYAVYDASEGSEIADCDVTYWGPTSYAAATTTTQCENDATGTMATSTSISSSQFQALENQYMNE